MNIVSVSWGDHLSFGDGDGRLDTPDKVARRMSVWRDELGARALHWRMLRSRIAGRFDAAPGYRHPSESAAIALQCLFVCLRSQSRPADSADQFAFNEPARADFAARYGADVAREPFDVQAWRNLLGEYLTTFVAELRAALRRDGVLLAIGVPRGDVLGPPLGNAPLAWREWTQRGLIDRLILGQNSSQCPSMWHQLWPMHRGTGYLQNYLDGSGLPPLRAHIETYGAEVSGSPTELYVARQWCERDEASERDLASIPGVSGLVFGSFRHDNVAAMQRGDWRAGRLA